MKPAHAGFFCSSKSIPYGIKSLNNVFKSYIRLFKERHINNGVSRKIVFFRQLTVDILNRLFSEL